MQQTHFLVSDETKKQEKQQQIRFSFVQCEGFRCLAYLDKDGKWRNWMSDYELKVVKVLEEDCPPA